MDDKKFWEIIQLLDWEESGDDEAVMAPAVQALAALELGDIEKFEDILAAKLHQLDTEAHAREIGEDAYGKVEYFSVDTFLYARCCVVANGRTAYENVLANPSEFPQDMDFEALLTLAGKAFEEKTGSEFEYSSDIDYETYSNKAGWRAS